MIKKEKTNKSSDMKIKLLNKEVKILREELETLKYSYSSKLLENKILKNNLEEKVKDKIKKFEKILFEFYDDIFFLKEKIKNINLENLEIKLKNFLFSLGFKKINVSVGEKFNYNFHEIIFSEKTKEKKKNLIIKKIVKNGFLKNEKIHHPVKVEVYNYE